MVQKANEQGIPPPLYREGTAAARRLGEARGPGGGPQTPAREPREVGSKGGRKRGNRHCTEELWAGEGGRGGGAGSGRPIAGTAAGEGCRASIRVHAHAQTRMASCCAPHQRPSVGTGSPGSQ